MFVEITTRSLLVSAQSAAGMRYARDFPVPVPASTIRCCPSLKAFATARSISTCCERCSKPSIFFENTPPGSSTAANSSTSIRVSSASGSSGFARAGLPNSNSNPPSLSRRRLGWIPCLIKSCSTQRKGNSAAQPRPWLCCTNSAIRSIGNSASFS